MGLPEIFISFETAGLSAISRSARGVLAVVVADETADSPLRIYRSAAEVGQEEYTAENYRLLCLAFLSSPSKVIVLRRSAQDEDTFARLDQLQFNWLAAPGLESSQVLSYIRQRRALGRGIKAVLANADSPDCEGIVNFCAQELVLSDGDISPEHYAVRIAALLCALPLTRSATYVALPEVVSCAAADDPDALVEDGKLILVPGGDGYRLGRAVTSLTTLTPDKGAAFQKIKILEGIDLIRTDIASTFENSYIGQVLNDYDNKQLLVTAINGYFAALEGDVLDKTASNRCAVSLEGQRTYLEAHGIATDDM